MIKTILTLRAPSQCQGMDLGGGEAESFKASLSVGLHRKFVLSLWGCWAMTIPESFSTIRDLSTIHSMFFTLNTCVSSIHVSPNILSDLSSFIRNLAVRTLLEKILLCNMPRKINIDDWKANFYVTNIEGSKRIDTKKYFCQKWGSIRQREILDFW